MIAQNEKRFFAVHLKDGSKIQARSESMEAILELYSCLDADEARIRIIGMSEDQMFMIPASNINYLEVDLKEGDTD